MGSSLTHKIGNSTIIIHSKSNVLNMSADEQREYFLQKQREGDPGLNRIANLLTEFYLKQQQGQGA